jgi:5-methyltetrahydrofolate--homocysteine methyltransferase
VAAEFEKDLDDYNSIMVYHRSFCRSFAEYLHEKGKAQVLSTDDMIAETYKGIRPAPVIPLS